MATRSGARAAGAGGWERDGSGRGGGVVAGGATVLRLPVRYHGRPVRVPERVAPPARHNRPTATARGHRAGRLRLTRRGRVALAVAGLAVATALLLVGVWLGAHVDGGLG